jgi:hypothetical protein
MMEPITLIVQARFHRSKERGYYAIVSITPEFCDDIRKLARSVEAVSALATTQGEAARWVKLSRSALRKLGVDLVQLEAGDFIQLKGVVNIPEVRLPENAKNELMVARSGIWWQREVGGGDGKVLLTEMMSWEVVNRYAERDSGVQPEVPRATPNRMAQSLAFAHLEHTLSAFCGAKSKISSLRFALSVLQLFEAKGWLDENGDLNFVGRKVLGS